MVPTPQRLASGIVLSLLLGATTALAIQQDQPFLMESWTLAPGSVFEILAVSDVSDRQVTWSLTKADGSFVQADRGPLFRERFAETGDFLLRGEVTAADQALVAQRTFAIHIIPDAPSLVAGTGSAFITSDPPVDREGNSVIDAKLQTVLIGALPGTVQHSIDVNSLVDADGDGDPSNDNDSRGTFFEADGSSLRLWFTDGISQRTITVRGSGTLGPFMQTIRLYTGSIPPVRPEAENPLNLTGDLRDIVIEDRGNGTFAFSVDPASLSMEGRAILLFWDFGDGHQSLLDRPVHTYAQNGQFTVSLQARDLATTEEIFRITGILPVNTVAAPGGSSSTESSSAESSEPTGEPSPSRFSLRSILIIGGGLLLAMLVGFAIVTIVGKIIQRRLDNPPPSASEGKPKKSPPPSGLPSFDQPPPLSVETGETTPMPIIDSAPSPAAEKEPQPAAEPAPPKVTAREEPSQLNDLQFKEEEAPSWLKQGHEEAEKRGHTIVTPLPASEEPTEGEASPVEPDERENRPLPPGLEPTPPPPPPAAAPAPAPVPAPSPPPPLEPVTAPASPTPPIASKPTPAPVSEPPPMPSPAPAPAPVSALPPKKEPKTPSPVVPSPASFPTPPPASVEEENKELTAAERERRRKKRARYRANKKSREDAAEQGEALQELSPTVPPKPVLSAPAPSPTKSTPVKKQEPPVPQAQEPLPAEKAEETDAPIAIIRADNISQNQKDQKKS